MFGWGASDFLAAKCSRKIGYFLTYFWAQIVTIVVTLIVFPIKFQTLDTSNISRYLIFLAPAGFLFMIATLAFYKGLTKGQVSLVSPIASSWSMIVVILSIIFLHETLRINQIIAIVLIISGMILASLNLKELLKVKKLSVLAGTKEGIIAMVGWGISMFLLVPASRALGWLLPVVIFKLFGILFFFIINIIFSKKSLRIVIQPPLLLLILMVGVLEIVAFFSYSFGVRGAYASIVAPIAASFPLITVLLARVFLKEKLSLNRIIGIVGVIAGLVLISI